MEFFNLLPQLSFSGRSFAGLLFFIVSLVFLVISIILFFHWRKYSIGKIRTATVEIVYLLVSGVLLSVAFFNMP